MVKPSCHARQIIRLPSLQEAWQGLILSQLRQLDCPTLIPSDTGVTENFAKLAMITSNCLHAHVFFLKISAGGVRVVPVRRELVLIDERRSKNISQLLAENVA